MENNNSQQEGEHQPNTSAWPPTPIGELSQGNSVSKKELITKYKWLDIVLGGLISFTLPSIMAGVTSCIDINLRPPPYSMITFLIGYFMSFFVCGGVALRFRRQYRFFGTSMLIGTVCSPLLFGTIIRILLDFPAPP